MKRRAVALLVETSNAYSRGLLEGIVHYVRNHESWSIYLPEQGRAARPPSWLSRWKGDGIIARIETREVAEAVQRTGLPVVDVSAARHLPESPWVETDDTAIARLASEHLLSRGFRHLGFCGDPQFNWSNLRRDHFHRMVKQSGAACYVYDSIPSMSESYSWTAERKGLVEWLKRIPRPIGILACYDIMAQKLLDVCRELDIAVPEQVAVIGVDNDELLCNLCVPPLSSIACDTRRTGYEAALLLDRMMSGEAIAGEPLLIEPQRIETRQSTDVIAIDDSDIARAVQYIREHACDEITVNDIVKRMPFSRRVLESRFLKIVGRTPHKEIVRIKMNRVKHLLTETGLTLTAIAAQTGFQHEEYLSAAFKKQFGVPPSRYRSSHIQDLQ